jgi:predicted nucleic acid-binding protein
MPKGKIEMKLYIETTVPNFLFADDAPEKKAITEEFYKWIKISSDTLYISELVLDELNRTQPPLRAKLLDAVARLQAKNLAITREAEGVARRYVQDKAIPTRYRDDALHVAIAVLNGLDVVVTWNMKHLANVRRIERINRTNRVMALSPIRIHTPEEVIDL